MQLSPNVDYWLRVMAITVPAISAIFVALVTYLFGRSMANRQKELSKELSLYQSGLQASLNKELENHKKDISKELEVHELQIQSVFQTRFYEFQTRYSWIHQRRAEAIEKLFALAARVQNDLYVWMRWENRPHKETKEEFYVITQEHFQNLIEFHDEKRIYFDEEIQNGVVMIVKATRFILDSHESIEDTRERIPELSNWMKNNAINLIDQTIRPLMIGLEDKFKELLSAEMPSRHLDHTSPPDGGPERKQ